MDDLWSPLEIIKSPLILVPLIGLVFIFLIFWHRKRLPFSFWLTIIFLCFQLFQWIAFLLSKGSLQANSIYLNIQVDTTMFLIWGYDVIILILFIGEYLFSKRRSDSNDQWKFEKVFLNVAYVFALISAILFIAELLIPILQYELGKF